MTILKLHDSLKKGLACWRAWNRLNAMCHRSTEIWLPSVVQWQENRPLNQSELGSNPSCALTAYDLGFDPESMLFIGLICDRDPAAPPPAQTACDLSDGTWRLSSTAPGTQGDTIHTDCLLFLSISMLPNHVQVRTRSSRYTMNWACLAGGRRNSPVGFKKMTKLLNNGNTYNKPIPQMFYLVSRPCCVCILLPPWTWGSAPLTHTGKIGRPLFPIQSHFLCPLPEDGSVTRARQLYNAQRVTKIRIWKREHCAESGRVGRTGAWEQLELVCTNSVLFYSIA